MVSDEKINVMHIYMHHKIIANQIEVAVKWFSRQKSE